MRGRFLLLCATVTVGAGLLGFAAAAPGCCNCPDEETCHTTAVGVAEDEVTAVGISPRALAESLPSELDADWSWRPSDGGLVIEPSGEAIRAQFGFSPRVEEARFVDVADSDYSVASNCIQRLEIPMDVAVSLDDGTFAMEAIHATLSKSIDASPSGWGAKLRLQEFRGSLAPESVVYDGEVPEWFALWGSRDDLATGVEQWSGSLTVPVRDIGVTVLDVAAWQATE